MSVNVLLKDAVSSARTTQTACFLFKGRPHCSQPRTADLHTFSYVGCATDAGADSLFATCCWAFSVIPSNISAVCAEEHPWILRCSTPPPLSLRVTDCAFQSTQFLDRRLAPRLCAGWCTSCRFRVGAHSRLSFTGCCWISHFLFHDASCRGEKN